MNPLEFVGGVYGEDSWANFVKINEFFRALRGLAGTPPSTSGLMTDTVEEPIETASKTIASVVSSIPSMILTPVESSAPTDAVDGSDLGAQPEFIILRISRAIHRMVTSSNFSWTDSRWIPALSYLSSKFAVLCMSMAIVLNRTAVFATTRHATPLDWPSRVFLRSVAIIGLVYHSLPLLHALHFFVPNLRHFIPIQVPELGEECPNPSILWGLYQSISLSNLVETFVSVIQGRIPYSETGMTLFEYSAAFQEVEMSKMLSKQILIISLLSVCSQIALHIQGIFNTDRYRLVLSILFGSALLSYYGAAVFAGQLLYFPSICVIGYLPQLVIAIIVALCFCILFLTAIITGDYQHVTSYTSAFRLDDNDDFYSCLMKLSLIALTSASKATYLTESTSLTAPTSTWLERENEEIQTHYNKEVVLPPSNQQKQWSLIRSGPTGIVTINRIFHAVELIRHFGVVAIVAVLRLLGLRSLRSDNTDEIGSSSDTDNSANTSVRWIKFDQAVFEEEDESEAEWNEDYLESGQEDIDESDTDMEEEQEYEYSMEKDVCPGDELLELFKDSDMAVDILQSVIVPADHPSRDFATRTRRRSSRSTGAFPMNYGEVYEMARLIYQRRKEAMEQMALRKETGQPDPHTDTDRYLCVVCKAQPREVVVWPCRCFAICEECRVALAFQSFKGCVCCRQEVNAFSRVYSP